MRAKRKIIRINEEKCTGCGLCIPNCPEGALQIIDGKARLISDLFCDGLGACVGTCPEGALTIEERPAAPYDEAKVMENIVKAGANTIAAHLRHLREHGAEGYYQEAIEYLKKHHIPLPKEKPNPSVCSCPGSQVQILHHHPEMSTPDKVAPPTSYLNTWPVQLNLVPVHAHFLNNAHLLISADCVGFATPDFHERFLKGKALIVGCPKLDDAGFYQEKLTKIFAENNILSITCLHMEVPCCFGLVQIVKNALHTSGKHIPFKEITIAIDGKIKE